MDEYKKLKQKHIPSKDRPPKSCSAASYELGASTLSFAYGRPVAK